MSVKRSKLVFAALSFISIGVGFGLWLSHEFKPAATATNSSTLRIFRADEDRSNQVQNPDHNEGGSEAVTTSRFSFEDIRQQETVFAQLLVAYEVAAVADQTVLEAYLNTAITSNDPLFNYNVASILVERYTSIDPLAAIAYIENDPRFSRQAFISHVLTSWIRQDPEASLDYFASITDQELRNQIGLRLLQDPLVISAGWEQEISAILGPAAKNIVEMARLDRLDPEFAFEDALNSFGSMRNLNLRNTVVRWVRHAPSRALERLLLLTNFSEKQQLLDVGISEYSKTSPVAALEFVRQYQPDNKNLEQKMLLAIATQDFEASLPAMVEFEERTGRSILSTMIAQWVSQDPEAALAYSSTLVPDKQLEAYNLLLAPYFATAPDKAAAWALSLGPGYESLQVDAMRYLALNPQAETYITALTNPRLQQELVTNISARKAERSPEDALYWLSQYENEPFFTASVQHIFNRWAQRNPANAADALDKLDLDLDASYSYAIISNIGNQWMNSSQEEAVDWLIALPASNAKETALTSLVSRVDRRDADIALDLISEIVDETRRKESVLGLGIRWAYGEPDEIEEIIIQLDLDETQTIQLRSFVQNNAKNNINRVRGSFSN